MTDTNTTDGKSATISFEFFPPQSTEATLRLWRSVERLAPLAPKFVSVTFGAGGTTRDRTHAAIRTIQDRAGLPVVGHLTCIGNSKAQTLAIAKGYAEIGVRRIVALRGDPPRGEVYKQHPDGFKDATELVQALSDLGLDTTVAAYPETHPLAKSGPVDLDVLKRKQDAGASEAISQFFFRTEDFLRFRDAAVNGGITIPIHPGILPIENFTKAAEFASRCGARVPPWMHDAFGNVTSDEDEHLLATAVATEQCDRLLIEGVKHLHFYTLNKPNLTYDILRALGYGPARFLMAVGQGAA